MSDTHWEETAQMFGSLFEKPKMTEKLLSKPPFKYLFDILFATIKTQGFAKKLYTEEETSAEFYDTKEKKIYFLRKMIAVVSLMNKEEIEAKPNKIVAGVEPDKTNLFLQAMYKACVSGDDSAPYVKKVLSKFAKEEAESGGAEAPAAEEAKQEPKQEPKQEAKPEKKREKEREKEKERAPEPPKEEEKPKQKVKEPEPKPEKKEAAPPPAQTKLERPGTASKRGPPKSQSNVQVVEENRSPAGVAGIIREDKGNKEDDDAFFVDKKPAAQPAADLNAEGRGAFVKNALKDAAPQEAEKPQEEAPQQGSKIKMTRKLGGGAAKQATADRSDPSQPASKSGATGPTSEAGPSQSEVEVIQKLIQSLSQNVNPLKKSIDFINDDIESMNKEMEYWRSQYLGSKTKYQSELAATEEQLQPLQNKLAEIEEQIKDKKFRIQASKSSILQNENKIHKLLYSVVSNK